jgi:hypothetical protein
MLSRRLAGWRALLGVLTGLLLAFACSTPTYHFYKPTVEHCSNGAPDPDLGESDVDCGGMECRGCTFGQHCNDSADCADGECLMGYCQEVGCENQLIDGSETAVDCGGECKGCRDGLPCRYAVDCLSKVCGEDGTCKSPSCTDTVRNGDELGTDCGGSFCDGCPIGTPCTEPFQCQSALCDEATSTCALNCSRGFDECDGDTLDPCETNLLTSADNCGACGNVCELEHAEASCAGGTCQVESCSAPWIRCNTDDSDGCEINSSNDLDNCGGCGMACAALHGRPSCVSSECTIECEDLFGDCDEDARTGCETSVTDVDNCGECGNRCSAAEGEPYCVDGECGFTDCPDETGDCNGDQVCETNLGEDPENCGRCGNICSAVNGETACMDGRCVLTACEDGWQNCDDDEEDGGFATGCESNVASDARNCGGCNVRCDIVENGTGTCQGGDCALVCDSGFEDCDQSVSTGCEADTRSDPDHCGGCNNDCDIPNAVPECAGSTCGIADCVAGFEDCNAAAGCETNISTSDQHCGGCGDACSNAGAADVSCSGGNCAPPACDATHGNCDGNHRNGCEQDVTTPAACGSCNNVCSGATPNCVSTGGAYRCQARIAIANAAPYPTAQIVANTLMFNATPHAGTNRMVLLAVASESQGNGFAGARPDSVRFGSTNMIAGPSQVGANDYWSPDLFIYYLPLGDSANAQAQVTVTVEGASSPAITGISVQQLLLTGVRQASPITDFAGGFLGTSTPEAPDPSVIGVDVDVATSGSFIYSFISTYWSEGLGCPVGMPTSGCPAWSVNPSTNLTVAETLATSPINFGGSATARMFGMSVSAASPALPVAGTYTPSWSVPYSGRMTHLAVVIAPAP